VAVVALAALVALVAGAVRAVPVARRRVSAPATSTRVSASTNRGATMKRRVWLSTFLFAAALSPVLLQTNTCTPVDHARLAVLELWVPDLQGVNVIEAFNPRYIAYDAQLPESEDVAVLVVAAQDPTATIEVRHDAQEVPLLWGYSFLEVPLDRSELEIRVTVPLEDGGAESLTYFVHIVRGGEGVLLIDIDVQVTSDGGVEGGVP